MPGESYEPDTAKVFKGLSFVLQGNFKTTDGKDMDHAALARLIRLYGGDVETRVTSKTKVVLTTLNEVMRRPRNITDAIDKGKGRCKIVSFDFIDHSLSLKGGKASRVARVSLDHYTIYKMLKRLGKHKASNELYKKQIYGEGNINKFLVAGGLYHVYKDKTGFKYEVPITRPYKNTQGRGPQQGEAATRRTLLEKYTLVLFESHASPHTYKFGVKYNSGKPGQKTVLIEEYLDDGDFAKKFGEFKRFFHKRTGIPWDKRLDRLTPPETLEKVNKTGYSKEQGETEAEDRRPFTYDPPHKDHPRGVMPRGWRDPVEVLEEKEMMAQKKRIAAAVKRQEEELQEQEKVLAAYREQTRMTKQKMLEDEEVTEPSDCELGAFESDSD